MDRVNTTFFHENEETGQGTNFDPVGKNGWTCTHGAWTGYLGEDGLSMYHDKECTRHITTYARKVARNG